MTEVDVRQLHCEKLFFFSEPEIIVSGFFVRPEKAEGKVQTTIVLLKDGTDAVDDFSLLTRLGAYLRGNRGLLLLDVRGVGAVKCDCENDYQLRNVHGALFAISYNAWMLGDNFSCMRAFDVTRAIQYLRSRSDVDGETIGIHAEDDLAFCGLLSAVADGKIKEVTFRNLPRSYAEAFRAGYYDRSIINEWTIVHGMLKDFDIPELIDVLKKNGAKVNMS